MMSNYVIRWVALYLAAALVAGCQTAPAPQVVVGSATLPTELRTPVVQPCIDPAKIDPIPATAMPPRTESIVALSNGAYADALRYRKLAEAQQAQLRSCASVNQPSKGLP